MKIVTRDKGQVKNDKAKGREVDKETRRQGDKATTDNPQHSQFIITTDALKIDC